MKELLLRTFTELWNANTGSRGMFHVKRFGDQSWGWVYTPERPLDDYQAFGSGFLDEEDALEGLKKWIWDHRRSK